MKVSDLLVACMALAPLAALAPIGADARGAQGAVKKHAFGAIAYQRESKSFGYSYDFPTSREAKVEALKQCDHPRCEVIVSFRSACAALAAGAKKGVAVTGATRQEAEAKATRRCGGSDCKILAWVCTK